MCTRCHGADVLYWYSPQLHEKSVVRSLSERLLSLPQILVRLRCALCRQSGLSNQILHQLGSLWALEENLTVYRGGQLRV